MSVHAPDALTVSCDECDVASGHGCIAACDVSTTGARVRAPHPSRVAKARAMLSIAPASTSPRAAITHGYEALAAVLDLALEQAQAGKGAERHAVAGEAYQDQQIVQLGEWMGSTAFAVGQACKKAIESTRLPADRAKAELLGAINYLAAAVIQIDRAAVKGSR